MRFITIRSSENRPDNATVRIRFRDWWFYIDATDTPSKRSFRILKLLIGMRLADRADDQQTRLRAWVHDSPPMVAPVTAWVAASVAVMVGSANRA